MALVNIEDPTLTLPTPQHVEETINLIYQKLERPEMNHPANAAIREGYEEAADILFENYRTYAGVSSTTIQGRSIAVMAVDYLNGNVSQKVLVGVPPVSVASL
ncbi:hypothetical protein [Dyadobacter psychrotolerans]|nr:hypothetical protein [Dyadobacter psychrotolerans]